MASMNLLPLPHLDARLFGARRLSLLTDDTLFESSGVRIAFSGRLGGVSKPPYDRLNVASHVGDDPSAVAENRSILLESLGLKNSPLIMANQVHGTKVVEIISRTPKTLQAARKQADRGADALVIEVVELTALLCFADCLSLIIVSPTGNFALVHAGWRGALGNIAKKASMTLIAADQRVDSSVSAADYNAYIGPHIGTKYFETSAKVAQQFVRRFGGGVAPDARHVNLSYAVAANLQDAGVSPKRVCDADICTYSLPHKYYSYRQANGVCGRHAALAVRRKG